jgi:hypothetical protein
MGDIRMIQKKLFCVMLFVVFLVAIVGEAKSQSAKVEPVELITGKPDAVLTRARITSFAAPADPIGALKSAKTIFVRSNSLLVKGAVVEDKLQKRKEFEGLNLKITRDVEAADLILELRHDLFTMYVYTVVERRSGVVVATGKLSSLGGTVAGKVAKRFLKQVVQARRI